MSWQLGIDITQTHVRAVLLNASYRRVTLEDMQEVELAEQGSLEQALQSCVLGFKHKADTAAVSIGGENSFTHRLTVPQAAVKQLGEVLPFELEAQIPVDIDELVYDYRLLARGSGEGQAKVLAVAARIEDVRERIELVQRTLGQEPDRVGCGPLPLANLALVSKALVGPGPIALIDLGGKRTEIVLLVSGQPVFARTLSTGTHGLPETAPALVAELKQTFIAWVAQGGEPVQSCFLFGGGSAAEGAEAYLSYHLGVPIEPLPRFEIDQLTADQQQLLPRFAKAISLALSLGSRPRDLNLRTGALAFQRGYGFLKEKIPLLSGLGAAIAISFLFSTWAESRALEREQVALTKTLGNLSKSILGKEVTDPDAASELLRRAKRKAEDDPMPRMDAFDVMVEFSKAVPERVTHDIEELEMHRGHVTVQGIAGTTNQAQRISSNVKEVECFDDVKISKITQVVNSSRQKYVLEFEVRCPDDKQTKKSKKKSSEEASE